MSHRQQPQMPYNTPVQPPTLQRQQYHEPVATNYPQESYGEQGRDLARRTNHPTSQHIQQPQPQPQQPARSNTPVETHSPRNNGEFEDLAKWTLDLANRPQQENTSLDARAVSGATVCEPDLMHFGDDSDTDADAALNIARDLANISVEDDYETPAFLRVREDTKSI
jgi:hypothetical protein